MTDRPTHTEVRRARKAQLVAWCESFELDPEGTVEDLRTRLLGYLDAPESEGAGPAAPPIDDEEAEEGPEEVEEQEEDEEADEEEEDEDAFEPKQKPKLSPEIHALLRTREEIARRRPAFRRQEWFRYKRLGDHWRRPKGLHSKMRRHYRYRPNVVSIGYRGPAAVRGLHPSGFREVRVFRVAELDVVDPGTEAVRIASGVGTRRRTEIQAAADDKGIRVLNRRGEE